MSTYMLATKSGAGRMRLKAPLWLGEPVSDLAVWLAI